MTTPEPNAGTGDRRYQKLFAAMDEGFCIIEFFDGPHGPLSDYIHIEANDAYTRNAGIPDVVGQKLREMVPDEADSWVARYGEVLRTGVPIRFEQELVATGRHLELSAFRVGSFEDRQVAVLFKDVTERRNADAHLRLVINELNHRVKNNLAMMQAIVTQVLRNAESTEQAREKIESRIIALARANDLLTGERSADVQLRDVVEQALEGACDRPGACEIAGPDVALSSKTALALTLALHELTTNAVKYGAWSVSTGTVAMTWAVREEAGGRRLRIEWRESGGPAVTPPSRRGFGSRLIERGLAAEMMGSATLNFEPDGLICVIDAPLED